MVRGTGTTGRPEVGRARSSRVDSEEEVGDVTREQFDKAVDDFRRADAIEKSAEQLRRDARATVLDFWRVNMDEFQPEGDGKTFVLGGVSVTVPVKKGAPARFDAARAEECVQALDEVGLGEAVSELFIHRPEFIGPEAVIELARKRPEWAKTIAGVLLKFTLPATPDESMTPRVSPVKTRKTGEGV